MSDSRRSCWTAVARCFVAKPSENRSLYRRSATETIEFENLVTAEERAKAARSKKQVVTEVEREHVMSGNLDRLVEEQRRIDEERDAELRRQEEALRLEEEAYYAAKKEASRRAKQKDQHSLPASEGTNQMSAQSSTGAVDSSKLPPWLTDAPNGKQNTGLELKDEEDFDRFLESVKARQLSLTNKGSDRPTYTISDSEEEVDFGYWEKAPLPTSSPPPPPSQPKADGTRDLKEVDLNLL